MAVAYLLARIFGARVALVFGGISLLSTAVLSALYLTSGYAIEAYVSDQLGRIPWDVTASHREEVGKYPAFQTHLKSLSGVKRVEAFGVVRVVNAQEGLSVEADGRPLPVQWLVVMASSDQSLLPPNLRLREVGGQPSDLMPAALVGGNLVASSMGLSAGSTIRLRNNSLGATPSPAAHPEIEGEADHHNESPLLDVAPGTPDMLFQAKIARPLEAERQEFNKRMLINVGSISYLPNNSIVIFVSMDQFARTSAVLDSALLGGEGMHGTSAAPPYVPEMNHLVSLDRSRWIEPWKFAPSLSRLEQFQQSVLDDIREITVYSFVSSDTFSTLGRMFQVSKLLGALTLLIAIPLLWLSWVVSNMLSGLLLMNERRLIGLAVIRGVPVSSISSVLIMALAFGGIGGGLLGLLLGSGLTILSQLAAGVPPPPGSVLASAAIYFGVFTLVGTGISILSGWSIIQRVRRMAPREAVAYVSTHDVEASSARPSRYYVSAALIALALGTYKFLDWTVIGSSSAHNQSATAGTDILELIDGLLNFVAIPLFLFGLAGIFRWKTRWIQATMAILTAPVARSLNWFIAEHMSVNRYRLTGTLLIASLATSLALLPQVAADGFYDRMLRGIDVSLGGDALIEYNFSDFGVRSEDGAKTVGEWRAGAAQGLAGVENTLRGNREVLKHALLEQYVAPQVFLPNQTGLYVNLLRGDKEYLDTVTRDEGLGLTRSFTKIVSGTSSGDMAVSQGFLNLREVRLGERVALGSAGEETIFTRFNDVFAFLPGQPTLDVPQREGYAAAEVDYLNSLLGADARGLSTIAAFDNAALESLKVLPSRIVLLVRMQTGPDAGAIRRLISSLQVIPQNVRTREDERIRLGRDMFISIALANLRVFMIGGLILAATGVVVVGLANFLAERRTFALLRLRGLPVPTLIRVSLSIFLVPVVAGILLGILLGLLAGYGISEAIWTLPRVYGVAGLLDNELKISGASVLIILFFSSVLLLVSLSFALWPFRGTANENIRKS